MSHLFSNSLIIITTSTATAQGQSDGYNKNDQNNGNKCACCNTSNYTPDFCLTRCSPCCLVIPEIPFLLHLK